MVETTFRAGGLATGIDTNSIVEQLTAIQRRPIDLLKQRQDAFKVQLSGIGLITSRLEALRSAMAELDKSGVLQSAVANQLNGLSAAVTGGSPIGSYDVRVNALATAAKARSSSFTSPTSVVREGTLTMSIDGTAYAVAIAKGSTLADVRAAIEASGAPVSAMLIDTGTSTSLSLTRTETGHEIGSAPSSALTITESYKSGGGQRLTFTSVAAAANAKLNIDGLTVERRSNVIGDVIAGTTLTLKQVTTAAEKLVIQRDVAATKASLEKMVAAYNGVMELVQGDLDVDENTDRSRSLGGDPSLRILQRRLQSLLTKEVAGAGSDVRTLADIGLRSARDGSLSLDSDTLDDALARDEGAVRKVFTASGGIVDVVEDLVELHTDSVDGLLTQRKRGIENSVKRIDIEVAQMEERIEAFRAGLIAKFVAMEEIVASLRSTGDYLAQVRFPGFGGDE